MHIPDGFLEPRLWGTLDVISGSMIMVSLRQVSRTLEEKAIPLMGVMAAFVFAAQMINLPIAGGTSAHLLGGTLLGILVGPWAGLIVISMVLMVQCFLFQDGGVAALGANIFNMGILATIGGTLLYRFLRFILPQKRRLFWAGFLSAWIAVGLSSLCCATELCLSHVVSWSLGISVIGGIHALLGILEGIVTGTVLEALSRTRPDLLTHAIQKP